MGGSYRWLLGLPGTRALVAAGLVARLPVAMLGVGSLLLVAAVTGSYQLAGLTTAAIALAGAAAGPTISRRLDRGDPRRVLIALVGTHVVAGCGFVAAALGGAPTAVLFATAVATGATLPQVGPLARQRWATRLGTDERLATAYALESTLDQVVFVTGPGAASALAGLTPAAGTAAALLLAAVGTASFALLPAPSAPTEPTASTATTSTTSTSGTATTWTATSGTGTSGTTSHPGPGRADGRRATARRQRVRSVLRTPGLTPVVAVAVALGTVFGAVDVGLVAYGRVNGWGAVAGALPSLITISSLTAGICFGLVRWRATLGTRLAAAGCLLAVGTALIPLVDRIGFVVAFAFVAGFPMAPVILTSTAIVGRLVAADRRTEGFGWIVIANGVGISLSAPVTGTLVDLAGARAGLLAVAAGGVGVAATTLVAARRLRTLADADRPGPAGQGPRVRARGSGPAGRDIPHPTDSGRERHPGRS